MENEDEIIRQAMAALGRRTSPKKAEAARQNAKGKRSEETRAKMREAQKARREREHADGTLPPLEPKRPRGRPRKERRKGEE